jgi:two-component system sensor histidine kinase SenX3
LSSHTLTRVAFGVVILFVLVQVVWWTIFGYRYVNDTTNSTLLMWQRDLEVANAALARSPSDEVLIGRLQEVYPHLRLGDEQFVLDRSIMQSFQAQQSGYIRMFAFEGVFFVLVVLSGLYIIAWSLRTERELKRRQENFLSAITHEFRTPISTLRLLIETALYRSLAPEKQRSYLERMERELTRLEATSEQVLASARLEQAESPPQLEAVDLNSVVRDIVQTSRPGLEARGAQLEIQYAAAPLPVSLDPKAFSIVLNNLLDNAVKYTPGAVKPVRVHLEAQGHLVMLHVEDEGSGIEPGEARRIFDKFYRVGSELTRESTGVGLGLYLVKSITEAMNGWVKCEVPEDAVRCGCRFTVIFPRRVETPRVEQALPNVRSTP